MTKLKIDLQRRIINFLTDIGIIPKVGRVSENHIDDNWDERTIYRGEVSLNINDGKLFTSNGKEILHLNNPQNYILNGLVVSRPYTSGDGIALNLDISNGYAIINNKLGRYNVGEEVSDFQINLNGYSQTENKMCFLFAKLNELGETEIQQEDYLNIELEQHIITGTNKLSQFNQLTLSNNPGDILYKLLYSSEEDLGLEQYLSPEYLLLSIIFIPENYNENSYNVLEPISLSTETESSYPIYEKSYKELLSQRIHKIDNWEEYKVFYKTQIIRHENNIFMVHKTFGNGNKTDINKFLLNDYLETSESESESEFVTFESGYLSKINVDYTDPSKRLDGKLYWAKLQNNVKKPTDTEDYKYIIGYVPNIDPTGTSDVETIDLPEITVNGVRFTVGYNNFNKDDAQLYFVKIGEYTTFDEDNYILSELESLDFAGRNIKEGYLLVWNENNIDYAFNDYDVILHYQI